MESGPLAGFTTGITCVRRWHEFGTALEQRGARVVYAPAIRIVNPLDDSTLLEATARGLSGELDLVIVTTAVGVRGWLDAVQSWGLADNLRSRFQTAELIARGPRSRAALKAAGFGQVWAPETDSATEVLEHLLHRDLTGLRILLQAHGTTSRELGSALAHLGAEVHELVAYGWAEPKDLDPLERLVTATGQGQADAVAFTTAAAVESFLLAAQRLDQLEAVLSALRGSAVAACIGPLTAAPLLALDVPVAMPARPRMGSLVREMTDVLVRRAGRVVEAAGHRIEVRGHAVIVDGAVHLPGAEAMTVAKVLVTHPGRLVPHTELAAALPAGTDVEAAVATLGAAFADSRTVQRIGDYGYRLAYEPGHTGGCGHEYD